MPLPTDPEYVCTAPERVRKHSIILKQLLASGTDPYAPHSYSLTVISMIETSLVAPPEQ
jgi:hypothetical protein